MPEKFENVIELLEAGQKFRRCESWMGPHRCEYEEGHEGRHGCAMPSKSESFKFLWGSQGVASSS